MVDLVVFCFISIKNVYVFIWIDPLSKSHKTPEPVPYNINVHKCAEIYEIVHSGIFVQCIVGFWSLFYYIITLKSLWPRGRLKSPASLLFTQPFIQAEIKENIKAPRHWPLCGDFTGDRWNPRAKGQLRGKCFHLMTSSCMKKICYADSMALYRIFAQWCNWHILIKTTLTTP